ncbi:hypothetical protein E2C01_043981 [Portunus trituberculatus]|uniref:Uncharacterized protein n=1 Tax=Portunus trituberculatus TaxID=210409 RepID=A0A5B7FZ58_PORTR|nr:hypothetical protein [Portunus trituberculatus]
MFYVGESLKVRGRIEERQLVTEKSEDDEYEWLREDQLFGGWGVQRGPEDMVEGRATRTPCNSQPGNTAATHRSRRHTAASTTHKYPNVLQGEYSAS